MLIDSKYRVLEASKARISLKVIRVRDNVRLYLYPVKCKACKSIVFKEGNFKNREVERCLKCITMSNT